MLLFSDIFEAIKVRNPPQTQTIYYLLIAMNKPLGINNRFGKISSLPASRWMPILKGTCLCRSVLARCSIPAQISRTIRGPKLKPPCQKLQHYSVINDKSWSTNITAFCPFIWPDERRFVVLMSKINRRGLAEVMPG